MVDRPYEREAAGGYLTIPDDRPGLGVSLNEEAVRGGLFQELRA